MGGKGGDLVTGMSAFAFRWAVLGALWVTDFVTADLGLDNYAAAGAVSAFLAVVTVAAVLAMARDKFQQALLLTLLSPPDRGRALRLVPGPEDQARREAAQSAVLAHLQSARPGSAEHAHRPTGS